LKRRSQWVERRGSQLPTNPSREERDDHNDPFWFHFDMSIVMKADTEPELRGVVHPSNDASWPRTTTTTTTTTTTFEVWAYRPRPSIHSRNGTNKNRFDSIRWRNGWATSARDIDVTCLRGMLPPWRSRPASWDGRCVMAVPTLAGSSPGVTRRRGNAVDK
jgi:hypothetical protein